MSTSDVVVSTLDSSSDPEEMLPKPEPPATPCTAWPEALVAAQLASPSCSRPCGLAKFAIAIWPRLTELPLVYWACTTPVSSMLMPVRSPVVKPFCCTAVTPKLLPYCVTLLKLNVMFMSLAPVERPAAWLYGGKVTEPCGGAVSAPLVL